MKKILGISLLAALAITFTLTAFRPAPAPAPQGAEIEWISFEEAIKRNEENPKKLIIDVYTDWCGWCKKMDKATFQHPDIAAYVAENYHAVKMDAEQKDPITFNGKEYKFIAQGRRGYHELAASLLNGRMSYPTVVFLDEELNMIQPLPGYKGPRDMDYVLRFFGENAYKSTTWQDFTQQYNSEIGS